MWIVGQQTIHMKYQALFSMKMKEDITKFVVLALLGIISQ